MAQRYAVPNLPPVTGNGVPGQVAEVAEAICQRCDELAIELARAIRREVKLYDSAGPVRFEVVAEGCRANMRPIFAAIAVGTDFDASAATELGAKRARDGVPLSAVMEAYRVGFRRLWDDRRKRNPGVPAHHDVADTADAGARTIADGTAEQVSQRDHPVGDGPADADLFSQRGCRPAGIRRCALVRLGHSGPRTDVLAPVAASCLVAGDSRDRLRQPATGCRPAAVPVIFSTFFTSLRMPNPAMTSKTPTMINQMPTTSANVTIESNG